MNIFKITTALAEVFYTDADDIITAAAKATALTKETVVRVAFVARVRQPVGHAEEVERLRGVLEIMRRGQNLEGM
jgi:hypothetical protein